MALFKRNLLESRAMAKTKVFTYLCTTGRTGAYPASKVRGRFKEYLIMKSHHRFTTAREIRELHNTVVTKQWTANHGLISRMLFSEL